MLSKQGFKSWG